MKALERPFAASTSLVIIGDARTMSNSATRVNEAFRPCIMHLPPLWMGEAACWLFQPNHRGDGKGRI